MPLGDTEARHRVSLALRLRPGVGEAWRWQGGRHSSPHERLSPHLAPVSCSPRARPSLSSCSGGGHPTEAVLRPSSCFPSGTSVFSAVDLSDFMPLQGSLARARAPTPGPGPP